MLMKRSELFVSSLARSSDKTIRDVTNSVVFGIRNDSVRKSVEEAFYGQLDRVEVGEEEWVDRLRAALDALGRQWAPGPDTANP